MLLLNTRLAAGGYYPARWKILFLWKCGGLAGEYSSTPEYLTVETHETPDSDSSVF